MILYFICNKFFRGCFYLYDGKKNWWEIRNSDDGFDIEDLVEINV